MGTQSRPAYRTPQSRPPLPVGVRVERADEKVGRMLGCSPDHAKRLRLEIVPAAITAILAATAEDPEKRENFRRAVLTAASAEPVPSATPDLVLRAAAADAREDVARAAHLLDPTDPGKRAAYLRELRGEVAVKSDQLRATEGV